MAQRVVMLLLLTAGTLSESQKIEALISSVENLKDAVFVRNGKEHDAKAAAQHLRDKWKAVGNVNAREFIVKCASFSSMSGKPYLIRFKDGREVKSAEFFAAELSRIEARH